MDKKENIQDVRTKKVLDFDFSTIMLFRCTRRKFAQSFKEGKIYFNQPKNWIVEEINGNKGRGDILEGTFMAVYKDNYSESTIKNEPITFIDANKLRHFRNKSIEDIYSLCFYGLNDNIFNKKSIDCEGKAHYTSFVKSEYFTDFSDGITKEAYSSINELEQPVVLFIKNPNKLLKKVKETLKKIGIKEEEIIISPIEYINKDEPYLLTVTYPKELLLKDMYYSEQNELRIIINSDDNIFVNYMNEHNNIIDIGNIEDIVEIYDYYFNDLVIEKTSKNSIMFNLPSPLYEDFENMELDRLITILNLIDKELIQIEADEYNKGKKELQEYIEGIIKEKYRIDVYYNRGELYIHDPDNLWKGYLEKYWKSSLVEEKINSLIEKEEYEIAYKEIENISKDKKNSFLKNFFTAKIFEKKGEYLKAIEKYSWCIVEEKRLKEALFSRAVCYTKIKKDNLALEDWNKLQEIVGYKYEIYANKGINFMQLGKLDEAIKEFDKSIYLLEENDFAYYNRSVAYYMNKNYLQAKQDIQKALKYNPTNELYIDQYVKFYKDL